MNEMDQSGWLLILMAFSLGLRHGFDLDHLATIDAITRTVRSDGHLSKRVGVLFSLGHGIVVTMVSLIVGSGLMQTRVPGWLDAFGSWVSIIFLFVFGLLNLWNVFNNASFTAAPVGIKSFVARKLADKTCSPLMVLTIGALFAFSFDTVSQVALFSISASVVAGWLFSGILGACFTLGMMASDGLNGWLVSVLIQRADTFSQVISRSLGLTISAFSLGLGGLGLYKLIG